LTTEYFGSKKSGGEQITIVSTQEKDLSSTAQTHLSMSVDAKNDEQSNPGAFNPSTDLQHDAPEHFGPKLRASALHERRVASNVAVTTPKRTQRCWQHRSPQKQYIHAP
jgi:hypothetical protein